jgi:hypothetical protein
MDLVVHMLAPRAPQPPLCTVIEEAWRTFFTKRAGCAVKYCQQPERAAAGSTGRLVLSMPGYPCRGWHDKSKEQSIIIDVTSCEATSFRPKKRRSFSSLHIFEVCAIKAQRFFGVGCSLGFLPSLRDSDVRIAFRVVLPSNQNF